MLKQASILCLVFILLSGCYSKKVNAIKNDSSAKSVIVWFEKYGNNFFFEFTDPNTILELHNFVNELTDTGCEHDIQVGGIGTNVYFVDSGKCNRMLYIRPQWAPGYGGKKRHSDPNTFNGQDERRDMLFGNLLIHGARISESQATKKMARSVLVSFETPDAPYYFEITGSRKISKLLNFTDGITVSGYSLKVDMIGCHTGTYSLVLQENEVDNQLAAGTDPNQFKRKNEKRDMLFNYLSTHGTSISKSTYEDKIYGVEEECTYDCRSWKKDSCNP
jgi:hypothetical protein